MEDMVPIELFADAPIARELIEKGYAEVVQRRCDQKFRSFVKCQILSHGNSEEGMAERVLEEVKSSISIEETRSLFRRAREGNKAAEKTLLKQDFDLLTRTNIGQYLPSVNAVLALSDLVVDVVGFRMLSKEITAQSCEIKKLADEIGKVSSNQEDEQIGRFIFLLARCRSMQDKLEHNDTIDLDTLETLVSEIRAFAIVLLRMWNKNTIDRGIALQMILLLLPLYTYLLSEFVKQFYFENQREPANYEEDLSLFDELKEHNFESHILDYYLLDEKIPSIDAVDIINTKYLLGEKGRMVVESALSDVKVVETRERNKKLNEECDVVNQKRVQALSLEHC